MDVIDIVFLVGLFLVVGCLILFMRKATKVQDNAMNCVTESMTLQKEGMDLQKKGIELAEKENKLLEEIRDLLQEHKL